MHIFLGKCCRHPYICKWNALKELLFCSADILDLATQSFPGCRRRRSLRMRNQWNGYISILGFWNIPAVWQPYLLIFHVDSRLFDDNAKQSGGYFERFQVVSFFIMNIFDCMTAMTASAVVQCSCSIQCAAVVYCHDCSVPSSFTIHSFVRSFIHSFIHSFIYLPFSGMSGSHGRKLRFVTKSKTKIWLWVDSVQ